MYNLVIIEKFEKKFSCGIAKSWLNVWGKTGKDK